LPPAMNSAPKFAHASPAKPTAETQVTKQRREFAAIAHRSQLIRA
jgi:hypothetical protein